MAKNTTLNTTPQTLAHRSLTDTETTTARQTTSGRIRTRDRSFGRTMTEAARARRAAAGRLARPRSLRPPLAPRLAARCGLPAS